MKKRFKQFVTKEDGGAVGAPANAVGGGNVAGLGIGKYGEPGVSPTNKYKKTNSNQEKSVILGSLMKR